MLSSLLRPKKKGRARLQEHSPFSSLYVDESPTDARRKRALPRHATADFTETELEDEDTEESAEEQEEDQGGEENEDDGEGHDDEDGEEGPPLLPIFSAAHLDSLPVYNLTHAIRLIILQRTETTLTWDQLRSPQVSQFLVKPMQQQIRTSHFSRATLYALIANCLQFRKESQANPGNAGVSLTRALVCELLAIKLLKEYNTRELIDALSYDFYPLQGLAPLNTPRSDWEQKNKPRPAAARISTLEVAIRASAKRFLAHPLVVQQLEAIWAGTIVFHSAADNLHRTIANQQHRGYQKLDSPHLLASGQNIGYGTQTPRPSPDKQPQQAAAQIITRRTVTIYDPRDASLFKLSRLRVPRYRQFFSTCSLAILLGLFLAVLSQRSSDITTLEIFFWFWSAGFMLDEVVGFNEQGFSLYIMSFWNAFDLGILLLLSIYYCMRLYGIVLVDYGRHEWNSMAYDVLATTAILLFPRLFSVLDHYRYFSQLLIAFRLMAIDLAAVFILILIACSGFFVAFTLSFGKNEYDAAGVAYKIFQILMGFTPAAWEAWETYNFLGRAILVLFLFICHFLVVTILITVLTNSFMAIVSNANEEHQFVFAVNTISMVKNDALFSYLAPTNILAWFLTPLRFFLPFRVFIKLNRTVIKITHFPLLFGICAYEKLFLASSVFEPTDLVENRRGLKKRLISFQDSRPGLFSPNLRRHESSIAGFQKDKALDEVFRLAPGADTIRTTRRSLERRQTQNVVNNWMDHQGGTASPPQEQDRSIVDRLERIKNRDATLRRRGISRGISGGRSVASDPAEFMSTGFYDLGHYSDHNEQGNDADGDDELLTNDDDEGATLDQNRKEDDAESEEDYFQTPTATRFVSPKFPSPLPREESGGASTIETPPPRKKLHNRNMSSNTILFNPVTHHPSSSEAASVPKSRPPTAKRMTNTGSNTPAGILNGSRTPKHSIYTHTKPRPIMPGRQQFQSVPNFIESNKLSTARPRVRPRRSSLDISMSEIGFEQPNNLGAVPSSFATQMAMATAMAKRRGEEESDGMMGRLMLARMKTLEEGFAEVVKEFRGMRTAGNSSVEGWNGNSNEHSEKRRSRGSGSNKRRRHEGGEVVRSKSDFDVYGMVGKKGEVDVNGMGVGNNKGKGREMASGVEYEIGDSENQEHQSRAETEEDERKTPTSISTSELGISANFAMGNSL